MSTTAQLIEEGLAKLPVLDIHTHLIGGKLGARGLHDILLYHMVVSDLYAAGCSNGARLTLHVTVEAGTNAHHMMEAAFKAFARALRAAVAIDPAETGVPSTKGTLTA